MVNTFGKFVWKHEESSNTPLHHGSAEIQMSVTVWCSGEWLAQQVSHLSFLLSQRDTTTKAISFKLVKLTNEVIKKIQKPIKCTIFDLNVEFQIMRFRFCEFKAGPSECPQHSGSICFLPQTLSWCHFDTDFYKHRNLPLTVNTGWFRQWLSGCIMGLYRIKTYFL